jgi:hypothetical protein
MSVRINPPGKDEPTGGIQALRSRIVNFGGNLNDFLTIDPDIRLEDFRGGDDGSRMDNEAHAESFYTIRSNTVKAGRNRDRKFPVRVKQ